MRIAEINDIASVGSEITRGLRARGHDVTFLQPRLVGAQLHPVIKPVVGPARALDWAEIIRTVRSGGFDIAHIHYAYLGNVGALGRFPYILHCHGTDVRGTTAFTRPLIRNAFRHAQHVFYSTPDLEQYVQRYRSDCEFLPNPIDTQTFAPTVPASQRSGVFICCALTEIKGVEHLYDACERLARERPEIAITAVESGPEGAAFAKLPNVTMIPRQHRWKLQRIINQHGIVLGWLRLGIAGMAELEAMACGRPVVTWFNQDAVYPEEPPFVRALEGVEVAAAIIRLADDPALRDQLGREGRDWVTRYHHLDLAAARVEEVAYAILDGRDIPAPAWPPAA